MRGTIHYVGLDVHKDTITIAQAIEDGEPRLVGTVPNGWMALERELKRLGPPELLRCCYEGFLPLCAAPPQARGDRALRPRG